MFRAAKRHFLGPPCDPGTPRGRAHCSSEEEALRFPSAGATSGSRRRRNPQASPDDTHILTRARGRRSLRGGGGHGESGVFRFTVTGQESGVTGQDGPRRERPGAPFSSSQVQHQDIHPVTSLRTQINKNLRSHALRVVTTPWTPCSWGVLLRSWKWERGI